MIVQVIISALINSVPNSLIRHGGILTFLQEKTTIISLKYGKRMKCEYNYPNPCVLNLIMITSEFYY